MRQKCIKKKNPLSPSELPTYRLPNEKDFRNSVLHLHRSTDLENLINLEPSKTNTHIILSNHLAGQNIVVEYLMGKRNFFSISQVPRVQDTKFLNVLVRQLLLSNRPNYNPPAPPSESKRHDTLSFFLVVQNYSIKMLIFLLTTSVTLLVLVYVLNYF